MSDNHVGFTVVFNPYINTVVTRKHKELDRVWYVYW